ncbi:hypothetical protein CHS0354_005923 [Potamilus streckersoni]|uniref:PR domain zinc finger protein 8 n=1 Tax=Potamilus streckersoni TaxID=2493646 RepID=A0AAE0T270_9BIVA|nr:hypothetical protein CHS0354_005923 [Potamilus streckersoni]
MGVITEYDIDYGRIFGPFPTIENIDSAHFIGLMTKDTLNDSHRITIDVRGERNAILEWLPYIQPARTEEEQNMEAYTKNDGKIYYRTLRIIRAKETIFVWYSKDFAQILGIPTLKRSNANDHNRIYSCEMCGQELKFPFSYLAHVRFQCIRREGFKGSSIFEYPTVQFSSVSRVLEKRLQASATVEPNGKRKSDHEIVTVSPKKMAVEGKTVSLAKPQRDQNGNPSPINCEIQEPWSAFRKVAKGQPEESDENNSDIYHNQLSLGQSGIGHSTLASTEIQGMYSDSYIFRNPFENGGLNNIGMLLSSNLMMPAGNMRRNIPVMNGRQLRNVIQPGSNLSDGKSILGHVNDVLSKQLLMEEFRKYQLPFIRSSNPMVEQILKSGPSSTMIHSPLLTLNLAQNWCAKCNTTFRMTSDLVYHMKSHHKREFDPVKKKRDDKLKCNVCQETFKERHHLTRHMTSHA